MRILMIAPQPFFTPRGTPLSVLNRINTLSKLGHRIDLVTYHLGKTIDIKNVNYYRIPIIPFINRISVGPSKRKIIVDLFVIFLTLKLLMKKKYDVIHSHEEAGFFAIWLAKIFNIKHIYDMHSSLPQQLTNFRFTKLSLFIKLFEFFEKMTIINSDALITICPELFNYVTKKFSHKKQWLIENVADNSIVFNNPEIKEINIRERYHLNSNIIILYTGTFEPYQGLALLIEAGKQLINNFKDVVFLMVGGNPEQVEYYKKLTKENEIDNYFIFTGQVVPEMVPKFIDTSDILVTPRIEGNNTPLKIYSYLRSGKPIVATNHPTHTQVLNDEVAVLTDCDSRSFSKGLLEVIKNKNLRKKISHKAKILAKEKYSYETYVQKTRETYDYLSSDGIY